MIGIALKLNQTKKVTKNKMKVQVVLLSTLLSVLAIQADSSRCTEGVTTFPSLTDCTQFYQCDALGVAVLVQCPEGLEFDPDLSVCTFETGKCIITTTEETNTPTVPTTTEEANTPTVPTTTTPEVTTTPEIETEAPIAECTEVGSYFPSSTDCSQYYHCDALGQAVQMNCPPGLEFHPIELTCDWPNGFCSIGQTSTEISTGPTEEPETTIEPEINEECPDEDNPAKPVHLPHPTDCNKFFKCLGGVAFEHLCPEGQHWSIDNNWCDFPENANCPLSTTESTGTTDGTINPTTTPEPELHPDCPADDDKENPTLLPNPTDCSKFFKCLEGVAFEHDCPEGQHWSVVNSWCDFPENANCVIEE